MENISKGKKVIIGITFIIFVAISIYQFSKQNDNYEITEGVSAKQLEPIIQDNEEKTDIFVHVMGEIKNPGIVIIEKGARLIDVIEAAGGVTMQADITKVNLAFTVSDGQKIRIPNINDVEEVKNNNIQYVSSEGGDNIILEQGKVLSEDLGIVKVNINTANQTEFETLPGIGPSIANKIISYRQENGKFKSVDEIKNVSGIGDAKYEGIKDFIIVKWKGKMNKLNRINRQIWKNKL